MADLRISLFKD
jgi:hypothetical protein